MGEGWGVGCSQDNFVWCFNLCVFGDGGVGVCVCVRAHACVWCVLMHWYDGKGGSVHLLLLYFLWGHGDVISFC